MPQRHASVVGDLPWASQEACAQLFPAANRRVVQYSRVGPFPFLGGFRVRASCKVDRHQSSLLKACNRQGESLPLKGHHVHMPGDIPSQHETREASGLTRIIPECQQLLIQQSYNHIFIGTTE